MKHFAIQISMAVILLVTQSSCKKENTKTTNLINSGKENIEKVTSIANSCSSFTYQDSLFFLEYPIADSFIAPVFTQQGAYGAFPAGLSINPKTGIINLYKSETGLRFLIWFVAKGSQDTCQTFLTISGINYMDSIFVLRNSAYVAPPVYNAVRNKEVECRHGDCEFDDGADDDNGDGFDDEPLTGQEVIPQGIALDKLTGIIDLRQSLLNGALGVNPKPGTFKDFTLNYRISDGSIKALNKIIFRLYYFKNRSQIPATLMSYFNKKRSFILFNNGPPPIPLPPYSISDSEARGTKEAKCRPPYIIIIQN